MPLPSPSGREKKSDFVGRCMSDPTMREEFPDRDQRLAVCSKRAEGKSDSMDVRFEDTVPLESTRTTSDGYLVAEVRCARTGCQDYLAAELGLEGMDRVTVYRPEEAVFAKDSLATYAGKPVTRGHPPVMVDATNWREYAVGDVGDEIARDGEFVRVPMRLMDQATIDAVRAGEREISMGYTTPIEYRDGVAPDGTPYQAVQTGPIRINHLAVVPRARGGSSLRIGDDASTWGAAPQPAKKEDAMPEQLRTIMVDGLSIQVTDQGAQAIEKLQRQLSDARKSWEEEKEKKDGEIAVLSKQTDTKDGEIAALKKQLEDATSPAAMADAVRQRSAVMDAGQRAGVEGMDQMTDAEIRRAVVRKTLGDTADSMSDDAISGAFVYAARDLGDSRRLATGVTPPAAPGSVADQAYSESVAHLRDAWKREAS